MNKHVKNTPTNRILSVYVRVRGEESFREPTTELAGASEICFFLFFIAYNLKGLKRTPSGHLVDHEVRKGMWERGRASTRGDKDGNFERAINHALARDDLYACDAYINIFMRDVTRSCERTVPGHICLSIALCLSVPYLYLVKKCETGRIKATTSSS